MELTPAELLLQRFENLSKDARLVTEADIDCHHGAFRTRLPKGCVVWGSQFFPSSNTLDGLTAFPSDPLAPVRVSIDAAQFQHLKIMDERKKSGLVSADELERNFVQTHQALHGTAWPEWPAGEETSVLETVSLPDDVILRLAEDEARAAERIVTLKEKFDELNARIDELERKACVLHNAILDVAWGTPIQARGLLEREFDLKTEQTGE